MWLGDTEFVLIPVRSGERPDALMVHLPASGLLVTGDVLMPYLGVPFTAEVGSRELAELREAVLVRLMEQRQLLDPFGFLVYAELAGAELSPAR